MYVPSALGESETEGGVRTLSLSRSDYRTAVRYAVVFEPGVPEAHPPTPSDAHATCSHLQCPTLCPWLFLVGLRPLIFTLDHIWLAASDLDLCLGFGSQPLIFDSAFGVICSLRLWFGV